MKYYFLFSFLHISLLNLCLKGLLFFVQILNILCITIAVIRCFKIFSGRVAPFSYNINIIIKN